MVWVPKQPEWISRGFHGWGGKSDRVKGENGSRGIPESQMEWRKLEKYFRELRLWYYQNYQEYSIIQRDIHLL